VVGGACGYHNLALHHTAYSIPTNNTYKPPTPTSRYEEEEEEEEEERERFNQRS
jgi:hypothetical protein